jgi:hypothetical protein
LVGTLLYTDTDAPPRETGCCCPGHHLLIVINPPVDTNKMLSNQGSCPLLLRTQPTRCHQLATA